ncbi:hypothetical protein K491DRAFT_758416 [Lophiostoma macrostomum CBS 122681]|uniref:Uncharacterized protein n=1 Tax=Lophiostoma macrostomum CBS 122681 TaxID=1314788 RepID=A0A6A6T5A6_9PLEO|nr:hypothetical protein K491DRAFT_758416 [Lophiostoma macrostomum CBS 122681]
MRHLRVEIKNEQLPISALFKSPLLAIRYNLPDRKLRRIQLKFTSSQDFDLAYQHLDRLGLRMSQIEAKQGQSNPAPAGPLRGTPGATCSASQIAELSNRPYSAVPTSYSQIKTSSTPRVSSPLAHQPFTSASDVRQEEANFQRPASAYSGLVNRERNPLASLTASVSDLPNSLVPPEYFPRPGSAVSATSTTRPSTAMERSAHSDLPSIEESTSPPAYTPGPAQFFSLPRTNDLLLPPRRELPFARSSPPKSAGSDTARPFSRTSTGSGPPSSGNRASRLPSRGPSGQVFEPPPLPQPTFLEHNETPGRPVSRRRSDVYSLPAGPDKELRENATRAAPYSAGHDTAPGGSQKNMRPLSALSSSSLNMQPQNSSPLAAHRNRLPTPTTSEVSYQGHQDRVISELLHQARGNDTENLAAYAAHNSEDRMTILNDFMMNQLDDSNFCTLVEDVSVCWIRIGLGLE